ncbi:peptidoglycan DD-metalloendopeptidase family protein [Maribacter sp.]|uniref:peptidoglycan DD-metalloendopeptidase family protein n=1 Tax=Maribacter sp. TaxID=1897614 RepID=UPI0025C6ADDC|nr:peptidoglycan DD-metalloendopeptidase family protein [Maribacter sp.]
MTNLSIYIIQVAVVFSLFFIIYRVALSRLTFHKINRYLLLSLIPTSFLLPIIDGLFPSISHVIIDIPLYESIGFNSVEDFKIQETLLSSSTINYWSLLPILYWLGAIFSLTKLCLNIVKLVAKKQNATIHQKKGYKLIITKNSQIFSFFNWIFVPLKQQDNIIIEHEKAHVILKHSIDIMIIEVFVALFWFNPAVYFYRKSLKSIHEFQADNRVLNKQIKTSHYLQVLLQNLDVKKNPNTIYSYFNYPILKRRIDMITKTKSTQLAKLKYLILLPVCALLLFAFTKPNIKSIPVISEINTFSLSSDLPSLFPIKNKTKEDITSFFGTKRKHNKSKKAIIHGGIDIKASTGTPVIATASGTISKAALEGDWGNLIVISHSDGYQTWYAHLNGFNIKENQTVKKGDIIGYVGNTGLSTSSHLHYEVKHNEKRVNPLDYITE